VFNTKTNEYLNDGGGDAYDVIKYASFENFWGAALLLVQICTESGWSMLIYSLSYKFGSLGWTALYFLSFHMITLLMLVSLLRGT
jgi:hypothetical protein